MRLTTKGRFAVTAMIDVAMHGTKGPVTLAGVSERQKISLSYLEQLFGKLRRHGLVASVRGPGGGYRLALMPDQVTIADIISAVDERVDATRCCGQENCQNGQRCLTHQLWTDLSRQIFSFLEGITLAQFVERPAVYDQVVMHRQTSRRRERPINPLPVPVAVM